MKRRVLAALQARATSECGEGASIVDYVCTFVASGGRMGELAELVASHLGHPVSRGFMSGIVNNVAGERLEVARRDGRREREAAKSPTRVTVSSGSPARHASNEAPIEVCHRGTNPAAAA
jgi:hypothetical protein